MWEPLEAAAAGVGAVLTLGAVVWWFVWPRVEAKLEHIAQQTQHAHEQLRPGGSVRRDAETAANAARQLPELVERLDRMEATGTQLSRQHTAQLHALEIWQKATEQRLSVFEQALLALLGRELGDRLLPDVPTDERTHREP